MPDTDQPGSVLEVTNEQWNAPLVDANGIQVEAGNVNDIPSGGTGLIEAGTWTPVITFATPGDLAVVYGNQTGAYHRIGKLILINYYLTTTTFTHTTASGDMRITGIPFAAKDDNMVYSGAVSLAGWNWAEPQNLASILDGGAEYFRFFYSQDGPGATGALAASVWPTATNLTIQGSLIYVTD
jgi:hypothetical protein